MLNACEDMTMVNPINDASGFKAMDLNGSMKARGREDKEPIAEPATSSDNVNISDASKQLEAIKTSFKDIPEIDLAKVNHLKAEIAAGNYTIDSNAIAKKMLHTRELA